MEGFDVENTTSFFYVPNFDTQFKASLSTNLTQHYLRLQQYFVRSMTVEPAEIFDLQRHLDSPQGQSFMSQLEVRLRLAALMYRQGQRSEARHSLRSLVLGSDSCCHSPAAKVRVALVLAAAGDFQTALEVVNYAKNNTKDYASRKDIEYILPFFERLAHKFKVKLS